jgi:hypothetical protein
LCVSFSLEFSKFPVSSMRTMPKLDKVGLPISGKNPFCP